MAWAEIETGGTFGDRIAATIIRPAMFVYLDWPTGEIRASTHHKSVTADGQDWTGVGRYARVGTVEFRQDGEQIAYTVGLTSIPQDAVDEAEQEEAIGRRAIVYRGLFAEGWTDPVLRQHFVGYIANVGRFKHRRVEGGVWVTDVSIEVRNGANPRRSIENHHSPATAESGDTAWRLLPTVARGQPWPTSA